MQWARQVGQYANPNTRIEKHISKVTPGYNRWDHKAGGVIYIPPQTS